MSATTVPSITVPVPTREVYDALREGLVEYDSAFGGKTRRLPESANAREWLRQVWQAAQAEGKREA